METRRWHSSYPVALPHEIEIDDTETLVTLLERACASYGERTATVCLNDSYTYADVDRLSGAFARYLSSAGLHFIGALMGLAAGASLAHVPYRGSMPAVSDVIGGQVAAVLTPTGDALANFKAGKLRILATSGPSRTPFTPDVPTLAEAGFPDLSTEEWFGFYAPARTPPSVIAAANAVINDALKERR